VLSRAINYTEPAENKDKTATCDSAKAQQAMGRMRRETKLTLYTEAGITDNTQPIANPVR